MNVELSYGKQGLVVDLPQDRTTVVKPRPVEVIADERQALLAGLSFVERAHNVVILGPPGVGKTHLAVALGVKAVEAGYSVLFLTLETLMTRLVRAQHENRLERSLQQLTYPKMLIATTKDWKQRRALREKGPPRGRIPKNLSLLERMER